VSPAIRRGLAHALLPAAILPVLVLGPGIVRSPETLWRRVSAEVQRLSEGGGGGGAAHHRRGAAAQFTPMSAAGGTTARGKAGTTAKGKAQR
jgi:hypothetical protein